MSIPGDWLDVAPDIVIDETDHGPPELMNPVQCARGIGKLQRLREEWAARVKSLCRFELEILHECYGYKPPRPWGAAVSAAIEALYARGLTTWIGEPIPHNETQEAIRNAIQAHPL